MAQLVKNLPEMQDIQVQSPGQEDPLEKELGTHSSTLAWDGQRSLAGSMRLHESDNDLATKPPPPLLKYK